MKKFTFLIPVYNDWASLKILLEKIELQLKDQSDQFSIMILNDFSTLKCDISAKNFQKIKQLKIINFNKNIGSQRAIAIGLKYISKINESNEKTEDKQEIGGILGLFAKAPQAIADFFMKPKKNSNSPVDNNPVTKDLFSGKYKTVEDY